MRVLHIAGLAIIFALVRSTTSTASGQRWATKPYKNPGGYARPTPRPNVHANFHKPPHTGMTSTMSGQHSQLELTETMTDDHPQHRPRPVITQKPGPISVTPLVSSESASEEHTMPPVMTEDKAMLPSEELTNGPESNKAMIEEVSEHDEIISVHEFKEVLHGLVTDALDKIVMKKAGIVGKLKTAKQNLIADNGEATGRNPQQHDPNRNVDDCQCSNILDSRGRGNCMHNDLINGRPWCFLKRFSPCDDEQASFQKRGLFWSQIACDVLSNGSGSPRVIRRKIVG